MAYLTAEQIESLLAECRHSSANDLKLIVKIYLTTGARWNEAENLKRSQVSSGKITYIKTKWKKNRTIPISSDLIDELPKKMELFLSHVIMLSDMLWSRPTLSFHRGS